MAWRTGAQREISGDITSFALLQSKDTGTTKARTCILLMLKDQSVVPQTWRASDWRFEAFGDKALEDAHKLTEKGSTDTFIYIDNFKMSLYGFRGHDGDGGTSAGHHRGWYSPKVLPRIGLTSLRVPVQDLYTVIFEQIKKDAFGDEGRLTKAYREIRCEQAYTHACICVYSWGRGNGRGDICAGDSRTGCRLAWFG